MFYQPELFIYVWILPVLGMVVLPGIWAISCMLYRSLERSRLSNVQGFLDLNAFTPADSSLRDRRKKPRILIEGPKANVAAGVKCCQTFVLNISQQGICLSNVPKKMERDTGDKLHVVFRTREKDYRMFVRPRWKKSRENGHMIGAEIINIQGGWKRFVDSLSQSAIAEAS